MKTKNIVFLLIVLILIIIAVNFLAFDFLGKNSGSKKEIQPKNNEDKALEEVLKKTISPSDFSHIINNKYLTFTPKTKYTYEGKTEEGTEKIEVYVTEEKKEVMGIKTTVVWDRVWLNENLIEDTKDWYAQDKDGNVWYFGEDSKEVVLGEIVNSKGSWEAGIDGAKPGIVMKANPKIGEVYYQEYYKGFAEDKAEIISSKETVVTPYGTFEDCLQTKDWNPLENGGEENKYYCTKIGGLALEVVIEDGSRVELIGIEKNSEPSPADNIKEQDNNKESISEEEAKKIALERVPGTVTDIAVEAKFGKKSYVVEIDADNGTETDVIIDFETGEVLGIET